MPNPQSQAQRRADLKAKLLKEVRDKKSKKEIERDAKVAEKDKIVQEAQDEIDALALEEEALQALH